VEDIRKNKYDLSITRYKPIQHVEEIYEEPQLLLERLINVEEEIVSIIRDLRERAV
jgi:type I restriction enzyme M protein